MKMPVSDADICRNERAAGKYFEVGKIRVFVPEGWQAFTDSDRSEYSHSLDIVKNGGAESEYYSKPRILAAFYEKRKLLHFGIDFAAAEPKALKPFELGGIVWSGFTYRLIVPHSSMTSMTFMTAQTSRWKIHISAFTEDGGEKISLEDDDVRAILKSIGENG